MKAMNEADRQQERQRLAAKIQERMGQIILEAAALESERLILAELLVQLMPTVPVIMLPGRIQALLARAVVCHN